MGRSRQLKPSILEFWKSADNGTKVSQRGRVSQEGRTIIITLVKVEGGYFCPCQYAESMRKLWDSLPSSLEKWGADKLLIRLPNDLHQGWVQARRARVGAYLVSIISKEEYIANRKVMDSCDALYSVIGLLEWEIYTPAP